MIIRIVIGLLSALGFLISAYFASIYHANVPFMRHSIPKFCRIESTTCSTLLQTPESRLFGVPNFDLGILFYTALLVSAVLPALWSQLHTMLILGSTVTVATGFYLSYVLVFRLHIPCTLCFASHVINLLIFILLFGR